MVRLKDIARYAGVSVMTVSKALRDEPDVSSATKSRNSSVGMLVRLSLCRMLSTSARGVLAGFAFVDITVYRQKPSEAHGW